MRSYKIQYLLLSWKGNRRTNNGQLYILAQKLADLAAVLWKPLNSLAHPMFHFHMWSLWAPGGPQRSKYFPFWSDSSNHTNLIQPHHLNPGSTRDLPSAAWISSTMSTVVLYHAPPGQAPHQPQAYLFYWSANLLLSLPCRTWRFKLLPRLARHWGRTSPCGVCSEVNTAISPDALRMSFPGRNHALRDWATPYSEKLDNKRPALVYS